MDTGTWIIIGIASASLLVGGATLARSEYRAWKAGSAELVVESLKMYDNPRVEASGRQWTVSVRNEGPALAYDVEVWLADAEGVALNRHSPFAGQGGELRVGEPVRLTRDLPAVAEDGTHQIWLGWRYARGPRTRDSGVRI